MKCTQQNLLSTCFSRMICSRLLHLCALASPTVNAQRAVLHNVPLSVPLQINGDNVQFELRSDVFLSAEKPLSPIVSHSELQGQKLQELVISHPLISFAEDNFYQLKDIFRKFLSVLHNMQYYVLIIIYFNTLYYI